MTEIYIHVSMKDFLKYKNPVDDLNLEEYNQFF